MTPAPRLFIVAGQLADSRFKVFDNFDTLDKALGEADELSCITGGTFVVFEAIAAFERPDAVAVRVPVSKILSPNDD